MVTVRQFEAICEALKARRAAIRMSEKQLAAASGVSVTRIQGLESGRKAAPDTLLAVARAMDLEMALIEGGPRIAA